MKTTRSSGTYETIYRNSDYFLSSAKKKWKSFEILEEIWCAEEMHQQSFQLSMIQIFKKKI